MAEEKGFTVEITSRYEGWWRYNAVLMCGCFDAEGRRTGFASATSEVAGVGSNLREKPADTDPDRTVRLETPPCDHIVLYLYLIPHTLPADNRIDETHPFEIMLRIACGGRKLRTEKRLVNQWSGASVEMRIDAERTAR